MQLFEARKKEPNTLVLKKSVADCQTRLNYWGDIGCPFSYSIYVSFILFFNP
jgi:hypothetical protein